MKKLMMLFVAVVAISFAACNGQSSKCDACACDSDSVAVDTVLVDSVVVDSVM